MKRLDVLMTPIEFENLRASDLSDRICLVFDVLRATSSMITGLTCGVREFLPARTIGEALDLHAAHPGSLLAGEREGLRIGAELTGGRCFDLGNSPAEFLSGDLHDKSVVITTTNGTRALRACVGAGEILIASFLNLRATSQYLLATHWEEILLVCSGTGEQMAYEDVLGAGALVNLLCKEWGEATLSDAALMARCLFLHEKDGLVAAFSKSGNGRRLLAHPQLRNDIAFCAARDRFPLVARMGEDGAIRILS